MLAVEKAVSGLRVEAQDGAAKGQEASQLANRAEDSAEGATQVTSGEVDVLGQEMRGLRSRVAELRTPVNNFE